MPSQKADLLLHPVRLRLISCLSNRRLTVKQLSELIADVPQTTLYRHIHALADGGIIHVVEENPVRGTLERVYALSEIPSLSPADLHGMSRSDYEQAFNAFLTGCLGEARRYLDSKPVGEPINLQADGVMVSKVQLHLSSAELTQFNHQVSELIFTALQNQPLPERKVCAVTYLVIPQT